MTVKQSIENKISDNINADFLDVVNESHMHNVPANSETHFKVTVISDTFEGKRLLQRHRSINSLLAEELAGPVHALALHTYTKSEWLKRQAESPDSPNCLGGSKI
ncbi:BolA family protein [Glaciecola petra]|uniref:BolA/IbaG family iron-sulfur metabolism protein n=1 Tax=Glaciecola petra TaxID=3075602 RepID=A0ABU2ZL87_9ALTE|nr:BolA/IbaG family iron-sulfur metabolism protein [Aestuariibacter sp. P117]MDT0593382.1 BolA/IbaG family iron-sulfur metabolism protein [Aestuariibacter sp. P117]